MSRSSPLLVLFALVVAVAAAVGAAASLAGEAKQSAPKMLVGIYDEGPTFYDPPDFVFGHYARLRPQVLRVNLYWGGRPVAVANDRRPAFARDPNDPAYNWETYDRTVLYARSKGIDLLFSIVGTPRWANGGKTFNYPPTDMTDLKNFATAAATRYSGSFVSPDGRILPAVKYWAAWNEPNNPVFLKPQFVRRGGTWVVASAAAYAKICPAVYDGIRAASSIAARKIACGVTAPRGNNNPTSARASTSPLAFLRALKSNGLRANKFDAYAHHPYYGIPTEGPTTRPPTAKGRPATAVTLGNFGDLVTELTRLYGTKRIWITEYGYQTNPPDRTFGVSYAKQAAYLKQAFAIARANARVDMMLWFLVRDEPNLSGWQSGLMTADWKAKPAFRVFQTLPRG